MENQPKKVKKDCELTSAAVKLGYQVEQYKPQPLQTIQDPRHFKSGH